jgi:hypothetical protein
VTDAPGPSTHWARWHLDYDDPSSALSQRLAVVVGRTGEALDALAPGAVRLISVCAGQGRDVVALLAGHPRRADVSGRLVEADPFNADVARRALDSAGLHRLEVVCGDASVTDAYADVAPAHLLLLCGIFGNVSDEDVRMTVMRAPMLCTAGAFVVWTRHRRSPDLTPRIRAWFDEAGFDEASFDSTGPEGFAVGVHRYLGPSVPLEPGQRLFTFLH